MSLRALPRLLLPYPHHCCAQLTLICSSSPAPATPFSRSTSSVTPCCPRPVGKVEDGGGGWTFDSTAATRPLPPSSSSSGLLPTELDRGRGFDPAAGALASSPSDDELVTTESDSNSKLSDEPALSLPLESEKSSSSESVSESYSGRADSGVVAGGRVVVVMPMLASSLWRQRREKPRISFMKTEEVTRTTRMAAEMPTERC